MIGYENPHPVSRGTAYAGIGQILARAVLVYEARSFELGGYEAGLRNLFPTIGIGVRIVGW